MRILIADDHAIVRRGLIEILLEEYPSAHIEEVGDADTLYKKSLTEKWDVIISDLMMPGGEAYWKPCSRSGSIPPRCRC